MFARLIGRTNFHGSSESDNRFNDYGFILIVKKYPTNKYLLYWNCNFEIFGEMRDLDWLC